MPLLRISVTEEQDARLEAQVEQGTYRSKTEAVQAMLDSSETNEDEPTLLTAYRNAGLLRL